ncbi:putative N-acetylmuramoyl-L-alanine amidase [Firmicutes bacterium CAG:882]|jgi:N-acetylmuramoyl-L-alanine amidase|nr:putative N-acetylmuramoyl-L-alanine amidase [Firmicutes bacterium CAG:882]
MKKGMLILSGVFGLSMIALILLIMVYIGKNSISGSNGSRETVSDTVQETTTVQSVYLVTIPKEIQLPGWAEEFKGTIEENLLPVNPYSRPGTKLEEVNAIVIHYVGNPGTTAAQNRSYFENIIETGEASVSSHFIVGLDGEIIQCVPLDEISYASNTRNEDTIAVETCHPDETGKYNQTTYDSMVKLTAYLCILYNLNPDKDVIRHYDVTGKECPKYFVDYENEWSLFKAQVKRQMSEK